MDNLEKVMLVEGDADIMFFEACLRLINILDVKIGPAKVFEGTGTGKGNALATLPKVLERIEEGRVGSMAVIVDADYAKLDGLGFNQTLIKVTEPLSKKGYAIPKELQKNKNGFVFKNNDGLPDVGLWVMPNNSDSGFLEDFIKNNLIASEVKLFNAAKMAVDSLEIPKFAAHHLTKAQVSTWLAWQTVPAQGLHGTVGGKLIDFRKNSAKEFLDWLKKIYK